jgi:hypothetical protein
MRNAVLLLVLSAVLLMSGGSSPLWAARPQVAPATTAEAAALKEFNTAIAQYMAMRQRLRGEIAGPVKDSTSTQLTDAADALAAAIQRARPKAQVGSFFTTPVATVFKRRVADAVRTENLAAVLAEIDDEGEVSGPPKIYVRLPVSAQMATMPASLLAVLPPLPKDLEYRILGGYLVLRDVDASLILDYIPAAVPR